MSQRRSQHLFIVRMWQEPDANAPSQWRGVIQHAASQQQLHFTSMADLTDFIHWRINEHSDETNPPQD